MRNLFVLAPLALLAGATGAQDAKSAKPQQELTGPEKKLAELSQRFDAREKEARTAYDKATTDAERSKALASRPGKDFLPEFRALAEEAKGTDTAAQSWLWVLRLSEGDPQGAWTVVETLLEQYIQSPSLLELPERLPGFGFSKGTEALRAIVEESPHERVRAEAMFTLGQALLASKSEADRREGNECLQAVATDYGKLANRMGSTYEVSAGRILFERDHLQIGMSAPDFEAVDENGANWKLSDYRGKVVVVDFWGNW